MRRASAIAFFGALLVTACASLGGLSGGESDAGADADSGSRPDAVEESGLESGADSSDSGNDSGTTSNDSGDARALDSASDVDAGRCIRFEGCVDSDDRVTISNARLTVTHSGFGSPMGEHADCISVVSTVSGQSLYNPDAGAFAVDGKVAPVSATPFVPILTLVRFTKVSGRGDVTLSSANTVEINDIPGGAALYVVDLCD